MGGVDSCKLPLDRLLALADGGIECLHMAQAAELGCPHVGPYRG